MTMQLRRHVSFILFIGVAIVFLLLFLASLPVLASPSNDSLAVNPGTYNPTVYPDLRHLENISISSPTPTELVTQNIVITDTETATPTSTSTPTFTLTPTSTSTPTFTLTYTSTSTPTFTSTPASIPAETLTPLQAQFLYFPYLAKEHFVLAPTPPPVETVLFCDNLSLPVSIPDNNSIGVNDDISISDGRLLVKVNLYLDISHSWVGDLVVTLTNLNSGVEITTLNRPGAPPYFCSSDDIVAILDDAAAQPAGDQCASSPHAISGIYLPTESLGVFTGRSVSGTWKLNVSDHYQNDIGTLNHWCLETELSDAMPAPTPTPTPVSLPSDAYIYGMSGQDQQLELDCESRSAVDWAKHFGFNIGEIDFLNHLPTSNDPDVGLVGNPDGTWGNIPPNDYGVHAPPVASLLRDYGLTANSFRSLQWNDLRAEIASGNPAIVWIIGGASYSLVNGTPHYYTASSTGNTTIVAPWEHTVVLVGYTSDTVTVLNGSRFITLSLNQFLDSWSVLDFMAVLARP